jgi:hypothetical protein
MIFISVFSQIEANTDISVIVISILGYLLR